MSPFAINTGRTLIRPVLLRALFLYAERTWNPVGGPHGDGRRG